MTHQEATTTVDLPVEQVWSKVTQVQDWPDFLPGLRSVRQSSHERYRFTVVDGGRRVRDVDVAVGRHPQEHRIAWRSLAGPRFDGELRLRPAGPGRTEVALTQTVEPAGFLAGVAELAGATVLAPALALQRLGRLLAPIG